LPNIFKRFALSKVEARPYQFPDAGELMDEEELSSVEEGDGAGDETAAEFPQQEGEEAQPVSETENPVSFAQVQADSILKDARLQAEELLEQARLQAEVEAEGIRAAARDAGRQEGYQEGMAQAMEESVRLREEQAAAQEAQIQQFLEKASAALDRQMDQNIGELRDLAMAVAEKVVSVSLKSSGDVICRMIQQAVDKRKRREWVHIYIAECDARLLSQVPASLSAALSALSDRVRIIPMADDESGTCIIEMPDEIIDASASTQLNNIRTLLMDATPSASGNLDGFR